MRRASAIVSHGDVYEVYVLPIRLQGKLSGYRTGRGQNIPYIQVCVIDTRNYPKF